MRRVVLDTSVLVTALRSTRSASHVRLRAVADRRLVVIATPPLFLPYEDVLKRPEPIAATRLSLDTVEVLLAELAALVEPVDVHFSWRPQLRDPGDELVLEAAVNGWADVLVTYNVKDFAAAAPRFGLAVVRPAELLRRMVDR